MWPNLFPARPTQYSAVYWRSLHYFNLYRLIVVGVFLSSFMLLGGNPGFGQSEPWLFLLTNSLYLLFATVAIVTISARWPRFDIQLSLQVVADVVFITLLMHASGGIKSGLGLLLLVALAVSSLVSRGRLAMFHAAIATIAVLLEQTYRMVRGENFVDYMQAGLLSMGFFATAGLAYTLARRVTASEQVVLKQGVDLANLALVNHLVIQDMQDGVLVVDEQGRVRQHNVQAERLLSIIFGNRSELLLSEYSPELAERLRQWRDDSDAHIEPLRVAGGSRQVRTRIAPIGGDKTVGAVIFLEDLSRAQAQAQQFKLAALGRLTANIAHEIRNPLSAIGHATQLLQEDEHLDPTQARLLQIIRDNTFRLDRMVQDVLQLNRKDRVKRESLPLEKFLRSFSEEFCQIEKIPPDAFSIEVDGDLSLCFDRYQLHQVLWNLSRNAWRHSSQQAASVRLCATVAHRDNIVQLDVIDDGPGVPEETQPQLFEPFFTTDSNGTGLGLYIARELCQANGASLEHIEVAPGGQFRICGKGESC